MADDTDLLDEDESDLVIDDESERILKARLVAIKQRCDASNLPFEQHDDPDLGVYGYISLPAGQGHRQVGVFSADQADILLGEDFERVRFLPGLEAVWCPDQSAVEFGLQTTRFNVEGLLRRLAGLSSARGQNPAPAFQLASPEGAGKPNIFVSERTKLYRSLTGGRGQKYTLKMDGITATTSENVTSNVMDYLNSLFFQIDQIHGYTFSVIRERKRRISISRKARRELQVVYPITKLNDEAVSLYWYGKSARSMPLLQYLAYYQCIEFYFPRYSQIEARKRVGAIVRRPTFRAMRDDDLDRVISAVQAARSGGYGSERTQLRAVINECIGSDELRNYLEASTDRSEHFSGKSAKARYHKIPIGNKKADLRNDVADRIYDIRCRVVHTKNDQSDDELKMILPFSDDVDHLGEDIDLIEFVSTAVLSTSSSELN